jgi:NAD(P)-dependent dehydrogenase (short-subunit alcohol dehydrogenase family)
MPALKDKTVLIIGRGSGIARSIALAVREDGGAVIAAGLQPGDLADAYRGTDISTALKPATNPARRIGTADDIAAAALAALTNGFLTGVSIPVDGGEHLV